MSDESAHGNGSQTAETATLAPEAPAPAVAGTPSKRIPGSSEQEAILEALEAWAKSGLNRLPKPEEWPRGRLEGNWAGFDFRDCDLRWIDADGAVLEGADFRGARLDNASFQEAHLEHADLTGASAHETCFRAAWLNGAKIAGVKDLSATCLGGANLIATEPPDGIKDFPGLKAVEEISTYLQGLFKIILAVCAFGVLTVLSFRDEQVLEHRGSTMTQLPLLQAAISPSMFAAVVPIIIILFQCYFAIYLGLLWKELSFLPALFPDGTPLDRRASPNLVSSYVRLHFARLKERWTDWIQALSSTFLGFGVPPVSLLCFWLAYLRRHDPWISGFQALLFAISVGMTAFLLILARPLLRDEWDRWSPLRIPPPFEQEANNAAARSSGAVLGWLLVTAIVVASVLFLAHIAPGLELSWAVDAVSERGKSLGHGVGQIPGEVGLGLVIVLTVALVVLGKESLHQEWARKPVVILTVALVPAVSAMLWHAAEPIFDSKNPDIRVAGPYYLEGRRHPAFGLSRFLGVIPFLDIADKEISTRPPGFTGQPDEDAEKLNAVLGADLEGADLRSVDANRAFLVRANLRRANLKHANLRNVNLRGANLQEADLRGAILRNASLREAWMQWAYLHEALLDGYDPNEPNSEGKVNLQAARLADVRCSPFEIRKARNYPLAYYGIFEENDLSNAADEEIVDSYEAKRLGSSVVSEFLKARHAYKVKPDDDKHRRRFDRALERYLATLPANQETARYLRALEKLKNRIAQPRHLAFVKAMQMEPVTDAKLFQRKMAEYDFGALNQPGDPLNMREADLRGFDLAGAKFPGVILSDALLQGADLTNTIFRGADLTGADFRNAKLAGADFRGATLQGADLRSVDLFDNTTLTADQILSARTDNTTRKPKGL